ncbi:TRAP transporter small permease [Lutibaculum baratangense]|uniref:TRAP transporter small permease protein n=1 Tax=Lutibaculum baratangense AMV1 TaxID=631454 RepID=V4RLK2_9HYPH|nr:TRAP transporter small permease [Lutibaculum baratangense]ESR26199.1 TRAP dicarboxylate transporter, DctQ subunit, unknown substrate 3 [Lutibaculum baratangense AMV1]
MNPAASALPRPIAFAEKVIELWALAGGILLCGIVLLTAYSLFMDIVFGAPFAGDFEIVEMGVAVAVFTFLPYCQLTGANVSADLFTSNASPRTVTFLVFLGAVIALLFSTFLIWRMYYGMVDSRQYNEITTVNGIPVWFAYVPILISLALLALASAITMIRSAKGVPHTGGPSLGGE